MRVLVHNLVLTRLLDRGTIFSGWLSDFIIITFAIAMSIKCFESSETKTLFKYQINNCFAVLHFSFGFLGK